MIHAIVIDYEQSLLFAEVKKKINNNNNKKSVNNKKKKYILVRYGSKAFRSFGSCPIKLFSFDSPQL